MSCPLRSLAFALLAIAPLAAQDLAVHGDLVHTMAGAPLEDGVVVIQGGRITAVGIRAETSIPEGLEVVRATVVTPGLIDAHTVVGLAGWLNQDEDQDQIDRSAPLQPELRAIDAYNPRDRLVEWIRGLGVTTIHTGHAPGAVISGQTMVVKTVAAPSDDDVLQPFAMLACTLGDGAKAEGKQAPGNRSKAVAMLRQRLLDAQAYLRKSESDDPGKRPAPDLGLDALGTVLRGEIPLLITVHRALDIRTALRLRDEFGIRVVLDGLAEAHLELDLLKAAEVPLIAHAPLLRSRGEAENATFRLGAILHDAGLPFAYQSGFESYVPKTRVVLWEAAVGAAHGLGFEPALRAITLDAARLLQIDDRVGSLEVGKDGDLALFNGDPFEYASQCLGTVIAGRRASSTPR